MATWWNALTGKQPTHHSSSPSSYSSTSSSPSADYPTNAHARSYEPPTHEDVSSFLTPTILADPSSLHPLAGLSNSSSLDYISLDDPNSLAGSHTGALPSRTFTDDLCYGTGITYLTALALGGAWGLAEGLRKTPASAPPKLKLNGVLNAVTRRGPFLGNNAGVIALVYSAMNAGVGKIRGKHDAANSVLAGMLAGAVWKSTRGMKMGPWGKNEAIAD
ncbi:Tim17/Tim22/Tim23/Pmp24 family-domain-containing protein [Kalaharituber pfeilii]|nr:Tim17/Tim22/Tim23/Pmp24 family-domain-containing protein [Kalaharituber pfeilii]